MSIDCLAASRTVCDVKSRERARFGRFDGVLVCMLLGALFSPLENRHSKIENPRGGLIEVLAKKGSTTTRSLAINDGLGNVLGLVDGATGAKVANFNSGPFGEILDVSGDRASSCPLRFQTKAYDEDLKLYYFGKRWYDPTTKSFLSRDPLREKGGASLYAYCEGNPAGNFDPIGLEPLRFIRPNASRPPAWYDILPAVGSVVGGGRSPWGGERGAIEHSRNVTVPMLKLTGVGIGGAGITAMAPAAAFAAPMLSTAIGDLALQSYVTLQTSQVEDNSNQSKGSAKEDEHTIKLLKLSPAKQWCVVFIYGTNQRPDHPDHRCCHQPANCHADFSP